MIIIDISNWLFHEILIERNLRNYYYLAMAIISIAALYMMKRTRLVRFSMLLWLFSGLICLAWELVLFYMGSRAYNFIDLVELFYHALTEAGPGLIIMVITSHYLGITDLSRFREAE